MVPLSSTRAVSAAVPGARAGSAEAPEEVRKVLAQLKARFVFDAGSVTDLAHQLGYFATIATWQDWGTIGDRLAAVTPEAVHAAARRYLAADNRTIGIFEPTAAESEAR